jgi:TRAP-type C4-dicarboxylate transport system substrate-binding protein
LIVSVLVIALVAVALAACGGTTTTTAAPETTTTAANGDETTTTTAEPGPKVTLKYAFFAPENTFPAVGMKWWAEEMSKRTNGQVEVQMFFGGTLLTPQNMYDGVLQGTADIGLSCPTYEPGRFPVLAVNDLPGLYESAEQASATVWDVTMEMMPQELAQFHVVTIFGMEPAYIMTIDKVDTLDGLKGKEIRIPGGPKYLEALGAAPVGMPQSEVGQALQTGVIKGVLSSRETLFDFKYAETLKFGVDYPTGLVTFLAVMAKDKYEALPDNVKQVMDDISREYAVWTGAYLDEQVQKSLEYAEGENFEWVTLSADEAQNWADILVPFNDAYVAEAAKADPGATDFYAKLVEMAAQNK